MAGILAALALWHFTWIKPDQVSWPRWIEHALNRYQTLVAGGGAIAVAWLSVRKISEQITLQRDQAISDKRFAVRHELAALAECHMVFDQLASMADEGPHAKPGLPDLPRSGDYLEYCITELLTHHKQFLPTTVTHCIDEARSYLKRYNNYNAMNAEQQDHNGPREMLHNRIDYLVGEFHTAVLDAERELNSYLK
jgi:hypothetical protein